MGGGKKPPLGWAFSVHLFPRGNFSKCGGLSSMGRLPLVKPKAYAGENFEIGAFSKIPPVFGGRRKSVVNP